MTDLKNADPLPAPRELAQAGPLYKKIAEWMTAIRDLLRNRALEGNGSPEGVITARVGTVYHRRDGGAGTSFYVKESGTGNTGWAGK